MVKEYVDESYKSVYEHLYLGRKQTFPKIDFYPLFESFFNEVIVHGDFRSNNILVKIFISIQSLSSRW